MLYNVGDRGLYTVNLIGPHLSQEPCGSSYSGIVSFTHTHHPYSASYEGGVSNEECLVEDSKACAEYQDKLIELAAIIEAGVQPRGWLKKRIMEDREMNKERIKTLVEEIQAIRIASPDVKAGADSPAMREALKAAKEATEEFGASSKEAILAWEAVEEIGAARNYENAMGASLEDECLIEKIEACEGIEEIKRVVNMDVYHE
jgi:hypothetical protein